MGVSCNGFSSCKNVKFPLENKFSFQTSKLFLSHLCSILYCTIYIKFFFLLADEKAKKQNLTVKCKVVFFLVVEERVEGMFTSPVYNSDEMVILITLIRYCLISQIKDNLGVLWKHLGMQKGCSSSLQKLQVHKHVSVTCSWISGAHGGPLPARSCLCGDKGGSCFVVVLSLTKPFAGFCFFDQFCQIKPRWGEPHSG